MLTSLKKNDLIYLQRCVYSSFPDFVFITLLTFIFADSPRLELSDLDDKFLENKEHCHFKLFCEQHKSLLR